MSTGYEVRPRERMLFGRFLTDLMAPPAVTAKATADQLSASGMSAINTASYSPKHSQPPTNLPPAASHSARPTFSIRFSGFLSCAAQDSGV
jgi:hypothetical protein